MKSRGKILLLDNLCSLSQFNRINRPYSFNYKFLIISNLLQQTGFEVFYEDANRYSKNTFYDAIYRNQFDAVIINANLNNIQNLEKLSLRGKCATLILCHESMPCETMLKIGNCAVDISLPIHRLSEELWDCLHADGRLEDNLRPSDMELNDLFFTADNKYCPEIDLSWRLGDAFGGLDETGKIEGEIGRFVNAGHKYIHVAGVEHFSRKSIERFCSSMSNFNENHGLIWSSEMPLDEIGKSYDRMKMMHDAGLKRLEFQIKFSKNGLTDPADGPCGQRIIAVLDQCTEVGIESVYMKTILYNPIDPCAGKMIPELTESLFRSAPGVFETSFVFNHEIGFVEKQHGVVSRYKPLDRIILGTDPVTESRDDYYQDKLWKKGMDEKVIQCTKSSIQRMPQKQRIEYFRLAVKGLFTTYYYLFLNKSSTGIVFSVVRNRFGSKLSWQLNGKHEDWCPCFIGRIIYKDGKKYLFFDSLLKEAGGKPIHELNDLEAAILDHCNGRHALKDIRSKYQTATTGGDTLSDLIDFVEEKDQLIYTQLFL